GRGLRGAVRNTGPRLAGGNRRGDPVLRAGRLHERRNRRLAADTGRPRRDGARARAHRRRLSTSPRRNTRTDGRTSLRDVPLFMDRHDIPGVTPEQVLEAHRLDLAVAAKHDVQFLTYWFDAEAGAAFCLARAPSPERLAAVHAESHGLIPNVIIPVVEDNVLKFLGKIEEPVDGSADVNPFRAILFTDLQGSTSLLDSV